MVLEAQRHLAHLLPERKAAVTAAIQLLPMRAREGEDQADQAVRAERVQSEQQLTAELPMVELWRNKPRKAQPEIAEQNLIRHTVAAAAARVVLVVEVALVVLAEFMVAAAADQIREQQRQEGEPADLS